MEGNDMANNLANEESAIVLPQIDSNVNCINDIANELGLPRGVLASPEDIADAWADLPKYLVRIPLELRDGFIFRMCVAASVGLFDGAINYIWNSVIAHLRSRIESFGLAEVATILNRKGLNDKDIAEIRDSELLSICNQLNIISEDGLFYLSQCREVRNRYSAAHPSLLTIDDAEYIAFLSRCIKYGLNDNEDAQGVSFSAMIDALQSGPLDEEQIISWSQKIEGTFSAQQRRIITMLFGMYCDPESNESVRNNSLAICHNLGNVLSDSDCIVDVVSQYQSYFLTSDEKKKAAAKLFFERTGLLVHLPQIEQIGIFRKACDNLLGAHENVDNFYNELPFAERLCEISMATPVPEEVQPLFVRVVVTCYVGNRYGTAYNAIDLYEKMIKEFSPKEISIMLKMSQENPQRSHFSYLVHSVPRCKDQYRKALSLINPASLAGESIALYNELVSA